MHAKVIEKFPARHPHERFRHSLEKRIDLELTINLTELNRLRVFLRVWGAVVGLSPCF